MTLVCPECGHENELGVLHCVQCGTSLQSAEHTPVFLHPEELEKLHQSAPSQLGLYGAPSIVHLYVESNPVLEVELGEETILGRAGAPGEPSADVDFTPYQAVEKGVSRLHAVIRNHGNILTLTDLNSTNGTTLNGERLVTGKPRIIKSNDEIWLGRLVMRIQFDE